MRRQPRPIVTARAHTVPAPTGGWNASSALDDMPANEAETLINWFPETTFARLRRGYTAFCDTGTGTAVGSLLEYNAASSALLAASDGEVWNVSTGTAVSLAAGFASNYWDATNYSTAAGAFLLIANGANTPQVFNGTTLVAVVNTIGGLAPSITFSQVEAYNQRIFYAESASLSVWYLPVGQFQGALTEFDFGPLCTRGGTISKIATWTRDNGFGGANEMFVIVTTKGEVLIYNGPDPTTWTLSARFLVGEPVAGPNAVVRIGPDCVLLCEDGFQPMAAYLQLGESKAQTIALSAKIGNAVTEAVRSFKAEVGWTAILYPQGNMLIFNIPRGNGTFYQYVVNTITGSWCQFQGMNAYSWSLFNAKPYFGDGAGVVYRADTGTADNGAAVAAEWRGSYQYARSPGSFKRFTMARPTFQTTGPLNTSFGVDVDFVNTNLVASNLSTIATGVWGTAVWGSFVWSGSHQLQSNWIGVNGQGYAVAPHMKISTNTISVNLMAASILFEPGGFV